MHSCPSVLAHFPLIRNTATGNTGTHVSFTICGCVLAEVRFLGRVSIPILIFMCVESLIFHGSAVSSISPSSVKDSNLPTSSTSTAVSGACCRAWPCNISILHPEGDAQGWAVCAQDHWDKGKTVVLGNEVPPLKHILPKPFPAFTFAMF